MKNTSSIYGKEPQLFGWANNKKGYLEHLRACLARKFSKRHNFPSLYTRKNIQNIIVKIREVEACK